ncbi:hypothetical protein B296_00005512 [Ensete ventricosum]|uniref:DUF547 domain-containing protein n=1 Tax=Ensete ventricosum TaxID=4639 RepID=A0A426ZB29_ENSVE|nr:hypothetical protein B296_00005512 [Ensete ventricosum]
MVDDGTAYAMVVSLEPRFLGSLRVYTAKHVMEELEKAKQEFLQAHVMVKKSSRVFLPRVLERYAKETCIGCEKLLAWVLEAVVDRKMNEAIHRCVASNGKRKASQIIEWLPYDSRCRPSSSTVFIPPDRVLGQAPAHPSSDPVPQTREQQHYIRCPGYGGRSVGTGYTTTQG